MTLDHSTTRKPLVAEVLQAATSLARATRYDEALALLDATTPGDEQDRVAQVILSADVAARRDHVLGGTAADVRLDELHRVAESTAEPVARWDADLLFLRTAYNQQLRRPDGSLRFGPAGRDLAEVGRMLQEAERLQDLAPDGVRRGWAAMCQGWLNDNLLGDREAAPPHYERALAEGRAGGDDMLVFESQRHLGDHDHDDGAHASALERWRESTAAAARAGHLDGTLIQQLMMAVLARDSGDEAGASAVAAEVAHWADAVGASRIRRQAQDFLAGVDPTRAPVPTEESTAT